MNKNLLSSLMILLVSILMVSCKDTPFPTPEGTYDIKLEAKYALGDYNAPEDMEGYANFFLLLSNVKGNHNLEFEEAGTALGIDIYALANEKMELPIGRYKFITGMDLPEGASVTDVGNGFEINATLSPENFVDFKSIELEINRTGDNYTIIFNGITGEDKTYHCTYTGEIEMRNITEKPEMPNMTGGMMIYRGGDLTSNYTLVMTDCQVNAEGDFTSEGIVYMIDLYSELPTDPDNWRPAAGTYNLAESGKAANTFISANSVVMPVVKENGAFATDNENTKSITGGTIFIRHAGTNDIIVEMIITLSDGTAHDRTAENFDRQDMSGGGGGDSQTSLTGDLAINLLANTAYSTSYGDFAGNGTHNWVISIDDMVNNIFDIDLFAASPSIAEVPVGTYTASTSQEAGTFTPGVFNGLSYMPTAYFDYTTTDFAAIVGGTLTISKEGTKYKIDIDVRDVLNNKITGSWTGAIELPAPEEEYAPAKAPKGSLGKLSGLPVQPKSFIQRTPSSNEGIRSKVMDR